VLRIFAFKQLPDAAALGYI